MADLNGFVVLFLHILKSAEIIYYSYVALRLTISLKLRCKHYMYVTCSLAVNLWSYYVETLYAHKNVKTIVEVRSV